MKFRWIWLMLPFLVALIVGINILRSLSNRSGETSDFGIVISGLIIGIVGVIIISRYSKNTIGWILLTGSSFMFLAEFAYSWGYYSLVANPGALPFGKLAAWLSLWLWTPFIYCFFILLPLLFPTGRVVSRGWQRILWISIIFFVGTISLFGFYPGPMEDLGSINNPLGIPLPTSIFDALLLLSTIILLILTGLAFLSVVVRYRISGKEERIQLKWFLFAVALIVVNLTYGIISDDLGLVPQMPPGIGDLTFALNLTFVAAAIGIAILKYRLYEIDVIIRKTLVYSSITFVLALVYFGCITLIQGVIQTFSWQGSPVGIALSTLATAALFSPVRRLIQNAIDRRFYRSKYNAEKILNEFSSGLQNQIDLEQTTDQLLGLIQETMKPSHLSLWIKPNITIELRK